MSDHLNKELERRLASIITDAVNRSINALQDAGAIDTGKLRKQYTGGGSKYYDIVTEQIEATVATAAPWIAELFVPGQRSDERESDGT